MTEHERTILRRLIDERLRARDGIDADGIHHGTENAYTKKGCRCDYCRTAASQGRRSRRQRQEKAFSYRRVA